VAVSRDNYTPTPLKWICKGAKLQDGIRICAPTGTTLPSRSLIGPRLGYGRWFMQCQRDSATARREMALRRRRPDGYTAPSDGFRLGKGFVLAEEKALGTQPLRMLTGAVSRWITSEVTIVNLIWFCESSRDIIAISRHLNRITMTHVQILLVGATCAFLYLIARFYAARSAVWKLQRANLVSLTTRSVDRRTGADMCPAHASVHPPRRALWRPEGDHQDDAA
jgi:hypothetical protein